MRHALYVLLAVSVLAGMVGCCCDRSALSPQCQGLSAWLRGSCDRAPATCQCCDDCIPCGPQRFRQCDEQCASGPPTGAIAYPYYTTRGPRDFLANNPRSIGP